MAAFRGNCKGSGQRSIIESTRLKVLVRAKKACFYKPYRSLEAALVAAGLADPVSERCDVYGICEEESSEPQLL